MEFQRGGPDRVKRPRGGGGGRSVGGVGWGVGGAAQWRRSVPTRTNVQKCCGGAYAAVAKVKGAAACHKRQRVGDTYKNVTTSYAMSGGFFHARHCRAVLTVYVCS